MTDTEITKACADAMGLKLSTISNAKVYIFDAMGFQQFYQPLHNDAQAMALVKKFGLAIDTPLPNGEIDVNSQTSHCRSTDINRAICQCDAKMQAEK